MEKNNQSLPDRALELEVKKHPENLESRIDLGSDYSMDASDPTSASQPGNTNEPVPSSGFPEKKPVRSLWSRWKSWLYLTKEENKEN